MSCAVMQLYNTNRDCLFLLELNAVSSEPERQDAHKESSYFSLKCASPCVSHDWCVVEPETVQDNLQENSDLKSSPVVNTRSSIV